MKLLLFLLLAVAVIAKSSLIIAYNNGAWFNGKPILGVNTWCINDICGLRDTCTEQTVLDMAQGLVDSGMKDAGYNFVELDDCWSATTRTSEGDLQPDRTLFPNGLAPVIDKIHSMGLRFGLYLCIGTNTCRKGRPGSYGYYDRDAKWAESLKIDAVKVDNCNRPSGFTDLQLYSNFSHYLNQSSYPISLLACSWGTDNVESWAEKYLQAYRIQMDHLPFYWLDTKAAGEGFGQGTWQIIKYVDEMLPKGNWSKRWGIGDPDFLMTLFEPIGKLTTMNFIESRTEFSFWAIWSAQMIMATKDFNMTAQKKSIVLNKNVLAINQDDLLIPAWKQYNNSDNSGQVWVKPLADGSACVLFWNRLIIGNPVTISVDWSTDLGFHNVSQQESLLMFDLWSSNPNHGTVTSPTQEFVVSSLVPKDVKMYKVICNPGPCLKGWWN